MVNLKTLKDNEMNRKVDLKVKSRLNRKNHLNQKIDEFYPFLIDSFIHHLNTFPTKFSGKEKSRKVFLFR